MGAGIGERKCEAVGKAPSTKLQRNTNCQAPRRKYAVEMMFALTPALSPRRGSTIYPRWNGSPSRVVERTCESFSLSLRERAGVRASLYCH